MLVFVGPFVYVKVFVNRIIFQPPPPTYRPSSEVLSLSSDGIKIAGVYLKNPNATYTILYSHGNAEDLGSIRPILEELRIMGFSIFAYDYRGYGLSAGTSSEKTTYQDIDAAYDYLNREEQVPANRIIALG